MLDTSDGASSLPSCWRQILRDPGKRLTLIIVYLGHLDSFLTGFSTPSFLPSLSHANCLAGEIFLPTVLALSPIQIIHGHPGPTRGPYSSATPHTQLIQFRILNSTLPSSPSGPCHPHPTGAWSSSQALGSRTQVILSSSALQLLK